MKISIIGTQGIPARYGGFETLAQNLVENLLEKYEFIVACSVCTINPKDQAKYSNIAKIIHIPLKANGLQSVFYDLISILVLAPKSDIVLILGCSAGLFLPIFKIFFPGKVFIINPDGVEWIRSKWNRIVRLYLKISTKTALQAADSIIIDNPALLRHINYKYRSKLVEIAYGGNQYGDYEENSNKERDNFWLTISRSVPENNLELIASVFKNYPSETWVLICNFNDSAFGKKFYRRYHEIPNIKLIAQTYDKQEIAEYLTKCKGYIHGHSAGGTNPSLVSAMFYCNLIICHNNEFNRYTTRNKVEYFSNETELAILINSYTGIKKKKKLSIELLNEYRWETISNKYNNLFKSLGKLT